MRLYKSHFTHTMRSTAYITARVVSNNSEPLEKFKKITLENDQLNSQKRNVPKYKNTE